MRIVFVGTSAFAVPSLQALVHGGRTVVSCVTQPDRPQGRGLVSQPSPVKVAAQALGIPLREPTDLHHAADELRTLNPEVGVVIAYGRLVPAELLRLPTHGMLGLHPSLLPRYRGASPIVWALLNGDLKTGVTVFRLNERMDAGDILLQRVTPIDSRDTAEDLSERLARAGAQLVLDAVGALERGTASFQPQDERAATTTTKLTKAHGLVEWTTPAAVIDRMVRALNPWPGVTARLGGQDVRLWVAEIEESAATTSAPAGTVVRVEPDAFVVATGRGQLVVREVQPAGRRRMSVREFLAGHAVNAGEHFDHA